MRGAWCWRQPRIQQPSPWSTRRHCKLPTMGEDIADYPTWRPISKCANRALALADSDCHVGRFACQRQSRALLLPTHRRAPKAIECYIWELGSHNRGLVACIHRGDRSLGTRAGIWGCEAQWRPWQRAP